MTYQFIDTNSLKTISQRVEAIRKIHKFTLGEMCEIMDTSRYLYNQNQKGKYPFLLKWAINISEKLSINFLWLNFGKGKVYKKDEQCDQ